MNWQIFSLFVNPDDIHVHQQFLQGGEYEFVNATDKNGYPIDPISLNTIPLNRLIRIKVSNGAQYYYFDRDTLLKNLYAGNPKNPFQTSLDNITLLGKTNDETKKSENERKLTLIVMFYIGNFFIKY
jgi:hypothetical protein